MHGNKNLPPNVVKNFRRVGLEKGYNKIIYRLF